MVPGWMWGLHGGIMEVLKSSTPQLNTWYSLAAAIQRRSRRYSLAHGLLNAARPGSHSSSADAVLCLQAAGLVTMLCHPEGILQTGQQQPQNNPWSLLGGPHPSVGRNDATNCATSLCLYNAHTTLPLTMP